MARLIHDLAADGFPVAVVCRVLQVPRSSYYDAIAVRPPTEREITDAHLPNEIIDIYAASRGTYGVRRVHADLVLRRGHRCGHCPSYRTEPSSLPILAAQRIDAEALARDPESRGWIDEADRPHTLLDRLDALSADTEAAAG